MDDIQIGTNTWIPQPGDTDADGLGDDWEVLYFQSPNTISSGEGDFDLDGFSDGEEEIAYTDPTDSGSLFAITDGALAGGTGYAIYWPSVSGRLYDVDSSTNLVDGVWSNLASDLPATPPENVYTAQMNNVNTFFMHIRVKKK